MSAPRFSPEQKADIVKRYEGGEAAKEIAKRYGCDPSYPGRLSHRKNDFRLSHKEAIKASWKRRMAKAAAKLEAALKSPES